MHEHASCGQGNCLTPIVIRLQPCSDKAILFIIDIALLLVFWKLTGTVRPTTVSKFRKTRKVEIRIIVVYQWWKSVVVKMSTDKRNIVIEVYPFVRCSSNAGFQFVIQHFKPVCNKLLAFLHPIFVTFRGFLSTPFMFPSFLTSNLLPLSYGGPFH